jgi:phage gp16-like protein
MARPDQIKAIHALRRQVAGLLEDDTYRAFLEGVTGKRSSKDLTPWEAGRVLTELGRLAGGKPAPVRQADPKAPLVSRLLREAYTAGWDLPQEAGPFDGSDAARRTRVRTRVLAHLQAACPTVRPAKRLEDWPLDALQACLEHLKGVVGARTRWRR